MDERAERPYTAYYSDRRCAVRAGYRNRRRRHRADGGLPASAEQHAPGGRGPRREDRPGRHRQLHQRAPRRHAPGRSRARGPHGASGRALHRHPRHSEGVPAVHRRGAHGHLHRRPLRRVHPHLRAVPGRLHGHPRCRRARHRHHQPQLRRPHGRPHQRGVPLLAGRGRRFGRARPHRPSRKIWKPSRTRRSRRKPHEIQGNRAPLRARHRH